MMRTVKVDTGSAEYNIHIGQGLLLQAPHMIGAVFPSRRKLCVVTDENVAGIYLAPLSASLENAGFSLCPPVIVPAGEKAKSFDVLQSVIERCLSYAPDRNFTLVALGGGVVGDLAGFAASILLRGVPFLQVPTTLLSQVDSSVGGKTGINTAAGKNLVGTFYQPKLVLIDTNTLKTLPQREMKAGYAEILKYALIRDCAFFDWLEKHGNGVLAGDPALVQEAIAISCSSKAGIVADDEMEKKDIRALLNFGHTFGHALEALGGYDGRLLHGEAVAIGMLWALAFSAELGLCPANDTGRVEEHMGRLGLMLSPPFSVSPEDVLERMRGDKKNSGGKVTLVLSRGIGQAFINRETDETQLLEFLKRTINGA